MAIFPPNTAITRILAALGLENVRSLKINAAVNDAVMVVTEQYVTGTQVDDLAAALETKEWLLVPKAEYEYLEEVKRGRAFEEKAHRYGVIDLNLLYPNAGGRFYPSATQPPPLAPPAPPGAK
jgi:hypothetical protein